MGDAEKKVARLKEDLASTERMSVTPKVGDIGRQMNRVFNNIRKQNQKIQSNLFWSQEKKSEFHHFFDTLENRAYHALENIENQYAKLSEQLSVVEQQKLDLEAQIRLKDNEAEGIRQELEAELAKPDNRGTWDDLVRMQDEYHKMTSMLISAKKKAQEALSQGDTADHESWLRDIDKIQAYRDSLESKIKSFEVGDKTQPGGQDPAKIEELTQKYESLVQETIELEKALTKIENNPSLLKKAEEIKKLSAEYGQILTDLKSNPLEFGFQSEKLQKMNADAENLSKGLRRSGRELKSNNILTESWNKVMGRLKSRMMFSFVSMINPLNVIRKIWSGFLSQNQDVANTFKAIGQNLIKVFEPAMRKISDMVFKFTQHLNVFTKSWFGIDLFDSKALEESNKSLKNLRANFDELNTFESKAETVEDTTGLPEVDLSKTQEIANKYADSWGKALNWALEHPMETLGIAMGLKFVGGLIGKGVGNLFTQGLGKLFGGATATGAATAAGTTIGGILGKGLYTGMSGGVVTLGSLLGGLTLTAGGAAGAITTAVKAGSNWEDLSTGAKVGSQALQGVFSAATGLGAVLLGASGPVGWAIGLGTFATAAAIGMAQTRDGIDSVKKETERLVEAQNNAQVANQNYLAATNNLAITMNALEQAEAATGLSGAALNEQVESGVLTVDRMTNAQLQVYNAYLQNEEMIKQLKLATEAKEQADKEAVKTSLRVEAANAIQSKSYEQLRTKVIKAWKDGSISAEEGGEILSRVLANADDKTQEVFGQSIPQELRDCFNPDKYESGWRKFTNGLSKFFNNAIKAAGDILGGFWDWLTGGNKQKEINVNMSNADPMDAMSLQGIASYAVGTNYVPNDQLAYIHKGEAVVPAKYNNPQNSFGSGSNMTQVVMAMTSEIANLRGLIQDGISVKGEFRQRGNDLVATIEKTKSRNGAQAISNAAFAR